MTWRSSEVEAALSQSQELLTSGPSVSASVGPIGAIRLYVQWRRTQKSPDALKLNVWLPAPLYARFEALKARFDPGDDSIEELRPSFAALRLYEHAVEAAGMTAHDEVEQAVVKLAKQPRHPGAARAELKVEDPSGALKEVSALPPTVEVDCLAATVDTHRDRSAEHAAACHGLGGGRRRSGCVRCPIRRSARDLHQCAVEFAAHQGAGRPRGTGGSGVTKQNRPTGSQPRRASRCGRFTNCSTPTGRWRRFRAEGYRVEGP